MIMFLNIVLGLLFLLMVLFAVLYATWLFLSRIRCGKSVPKSFLRWVRDLFDAASGLG